MDPAAQDPEATSGTPVRVTTGSGAVRGLGTSGTASVGIRPTATVDATERIGTRTEDPELRAILDNAPPLPSAGVHVLGRSERSALGDFLERTYDGDAALMWEAMTEMARTSQTDMDLAKRLRNAQQQGKVDSKRAEMSTVEDQNSAERRSAGFNLTMSIGAAAASYAGYKYGEAAGNPNMGVAMSQAANSLVSATGQYLNKTAGPQREADQLKVKGMRHQMMQEVFEQGIENAKQNYDEAKEGMKLALKILNEHAERQTQITTTITRI
ncbi:MAG TPA: hypothetical protein VLC93_13645 [Myxococcota bacterium]|nr:hypothetical protein [Myxococcota bacterium]